MHTCVHIILRVCWGVAAYSLRALSDSFLIPPPGYYRGADAPAGWDVVERLAPLPTPGASLQPVCVRSVRVCDFANIGEPRLAGDMHLESVGEWLTTACVPLRIPIPF
jgi:hypothetical protein